MSQIIVGSDGSSRAEDAAAFAGRLAAATGAAITLAGAYAHPDWPAGPVTMQYGEQLREETEAMLERMRPLLGSVDVALRALPDPSPARALHALADSEDAALIVIGSTHRGRVGRVLPGSTAERLLHGSPCPVAVVPVGYRERAGAPVATIAVGYDGSGESRAAVAAAARVAERFDACVRVIRAFERVSATGAPTLMSAPGYVAIHQELRRAAEDDVRRLVAELPESVSAEPVLATGDAARELALESVGADLMLLGARGYGPVRGVLLGGVSHVVVREAACPVIVLPRGARDGIETLFAGASEVSA